MLDPYCVFVGVVSFFFFVCLFFFSGFFSLSITKF